VQSEHGSGNSAGNELRAGGPPASIYILDRNFNIKFVNETAAERFHCKACDLLGKPVWELLGRMQSETGREHLMQTVLTGNPIQSITEVVFPSGKRTLTTVLVPFKNEEGIVTDLIGVSYDITGQREKDQLVRNKMEVILGYSDMLSGIVGDDKIRELIELIDRIRKASIEIKDRLDSV